MAGEDAAFCKVLAANGAVLPLAQLLCNSISSHESRAAEYECAATAAWALSNMLWGDPSQVTPCLLPPVGTVFLALHCIVMDMRLGGGQVREPGWKIYRGFA